MSQIINVTYSKNPFAEEPQLPLKDNCGRVLFFLDSPTIDFEGEGTTCLPLVANVNISELSGNTLSIQSDGLYVSGGTEVIVPGENTQIIFNANGVLGASSGMTWDGSIFTINPDANSQFTVDVNGIGSFFYNFAMQQGEFTANAGGLNYQSPGNNPLLSVSTDETYIGTINSWIDFEESNQQAEIGGTGGLIIDNLASTGTTMVVADSSGLLSTQPIPTSPVTSVFGRTGDVTSTNGDYNTSQVTENGNLYFTTGRVLATVLTGYVRAPGTISSSDTVLSAIEKLAGNIAGTANGIAYFNGSGVLTSGSQLTFPSNTVKLTDGLNFISMAANNFTMTAPSVSLDTTAISRGALFVQDGHGSEVNIISSGQIAMNLSGTNTALLDIAPSFAAGASAQAAIRLRHFTLLGTPLDGAIEFDGNHLYFDIGSSRFQVDQQVSGTTAGGDLSGTYPNPTVLNSAVIGKVLTGYVSGAGVVSASDSILSAIEKLNGNIGALVTGVSSVKNSDATLTISPSGGTGAVVASLNLANANTWTATQNFNSGRLNIWGNPSTLQVGGASSANFYFELIANGASGAIQFFCPSTYFPVFYSSGVEIFRIPTSGNILIGTTTDDGTNKLQVAGSIAFSSGNGELTFSGGSNNPTLSILRTSSSGPSTLVIGSDNTTFSQNTSGEFRFFCNTGGWFPTFYSNGSEALRISTSGNMLIGTTSDDSVNKLQVNGGVKATEYKLAALNAAPSSSTDTGTLGEIRVTAGFIYVCTATNTWVRTALSTF